MLERPSFMMGFTWDTSTTRYQTLPSDRILLLSSVTRQFDQTARQSVGNRYHWLLSAFMTSLQFQFPRFFISASELFIFFRFSQNCNLQRVFEEPPPYRKNSKKCGRRGRGLPPFGSVAHLTTDFLFPGANARSSSICSQRYFAPLPLLLLLPPPPPLHAAAPHAPLSYNLIMAASAVCWACGRIEKRISRASVILRTHRLSSALQPLQPFKSLIKPHNRTAAMAAAQLLQDIDGVRNCFRAEEVNVFLYITRPQRNSLFCLEQVRIIEKINEIERNGSKVGAVSCLTAKLSACTDNSYVVLNSDCSREERNDQKCYQAAQHEDRAKAAGGSSGRAD
jgi:hypothetical protein